MQYTVNITIGGQGESLYLPVHGCSQAECRVYADATVLLDTGSTDLWIDPTGLDIRFTNTTDIITQEAYGIGAVQGRIAFAELKVGDFVIPSQGAWYLLLKLRKSMTTSAPAFLNASEVGMTLRCRITSMLME